jgi:hypothetical protein
MANKVLASKKLYFNSRLTNLAMWIGLSAFDIKAEEFQGLGADKRLQTKS